MSAPALHILFRRAFLLGAHYHENPQDRNSVAPPEILGKVIEAFRERGIVAETSASRYGNLYRSAYWAIYLLSSVAAGLALLTMALPGFSAWFVALEAVTILLILAIFVLGSKQKWHAQWLAFRKQAEFIRYLPVVHIAYHLSPHLTKTPVEPIDISIEEREHLAKLNQLISSDGGLDQDVKQWVRSILRGQIDYHERRAFEEGFIHERIQKIVLLCFVVTALAVLAHAGFHTIWISVVAAFFPPLAAALTGAAAHAEMVRLKLESESVAKDLSEIERVLTNPSASNEEVKDCLDAFLETVFGEFVIWHRSMQHKPLPLT